MGFFERAPLSLEPRVAKHKDEFTEISKDTEAAVASVRQPQSVLLEKENNLLRQLARCEALHREHVDA